VQPTESPLSDTRESALPTRYFAIDYIKAIAIVAVVLNHAGPPAANYESTWFDRFFREALMQFHVPSFLAVSGFLYANAAVMDAATCRRRLVRIVVPYLVASLLVFVLLFVMLAQRIAGSRARLLFGTP
jgi:fucose 4-O-acetylase-like acetyltransferase